MLMVSGRLSGIFNVVKQSSCTLLVKGDRPKDAAHDKREKKVEKGKEKKKIARITLFLRRKRMKLPSSKNVIQALNGYLN